MDMIFYLCIGAGAGMLSGLFGIGGGIIIVPALVALFSYHALFLTADVLHIAIGTSLAAMIFTSSSSAYAYHRHQALQWPLFWRMLPGLCLGLFFGKFLTAHLSNEGLTYLFSVFLILIALYLFMNPHPPSSRSQSISSTIFSLQKQLIILGSGFLVGILSTLFGVGGGLLMVPMFLMLQYPMREATGTSALCGFVPALLGSLLLSQNVVVTGSVQHFTTGYIYWPAALSIAVSSMIFAPLGTAVAFHINTLLLKRLFAVILLANALHLLF